MKKSFVFVLLIALALLASCKVVQPEEKLRSINTQGELVLETENLSAYLAFMEGDTVTKYAKLDSSNKDLGLTVNGNDITFRTTEEVSVVIGTTENMNLTIDAPNAEIVHYGKANAVNLKAVKDNTYKGKATTVSLRIAKGHVELQAPVGTFAVEASSGVIVDVMEGGSTAVLKVSLSEGAAVQAVKINVTGNGNLGMVDANADMDLSVASTAKAAAIIIKSGNIAIQGNIDSAVVSPEAKDVKLIVEEGTVLNKLDIQGSAVLSGEGTVASVEIKGIMEIDGATVGEIVATENSAEITVTSGVINDLKAESNVSGFVLNDNHSFVKGNSCQEGVILKDSQGETVLLHKHEFLKEVSLSKEATAEEEGLLVEVCSCGASKSTVLPLLLDSKGFNPETLIIGDWKDEAFNQVFTFRPDKTGFCVYVGEEAIDTFTYAIDEEMIYLTIDQMTMGLIYVYEEKAKSVTIFAPELGEQTTLVHVSTTPSKLPTPKPVYNPHNEIIGTWHDERTGNTYTFRTDKKGFISYPGLIDVENFSYCFAKEQLIITLPHGSFAFDYHYWEYLDEVTLFGIMHDTNLHLKRISRKPSAQPSVNYGPEITKEELLGEWRTVLEEYDGIPITAGLLFNADDTFFLKSYYGDECNISDPFVYTVKDSIITLHIENQYDLLKIQYTGNTLLVSSPEQLFFTKLQEAE